LIRKRDKNLSSDDKAKQKLGLIIDKFDCLITLTDCHR